MLIFLWRLYDKVIRTCTKFNRDSLKAGKLVRGYIDYIVALNKTICIYFMGSVRHSTMRYKLCDKIIIPSARV